MSSNELNFLSGVDFSTPGKATTSQLNKDRKDGYIVIANPGRTRKSDRHDISIARFCERQAAVPQHVSVGLAGKDVLFVLDSTLPEHESIMLYVQPSTKIIASKAKALQIFEALSVKLPAGPDSYTVIAFDLVHMFGNIYKAVFSTPNEVVMSSPTGPGAKHF